MKLIDNSILESFVNIGITIMLFNWLIACMRNIKAV